MCHFPLLLLKVGVVTQVLGLETRASQTSGVLSVPFQEASQALQGACHPRVSDWESHSTCYPMFASHVYCIPTLWSCALTADVFDLAPISAHHHLLTACLPHAVLPRISHPRPGTVPRQCANSLFYQPIYKDLVMFTLAFSQCMKREELASE